MPIAFKEWAVTVRALAEGEQLVTLRKGGLPRAGQALQARPRALLPVPHLRPPAGRPRARVPPARAAPRARGGRLERRRAAAAHVRLAARPLQQPDRVRIRAWAEVTDHFTVADPRCVDALSPFYVWTPDYAEKRLGWRGRQPLHVLLLRTYRIPRPVTVKVKDEYTGAQRLDRAAARTPVRGHAGALRRRVRARLRGDRGDHRAKRPASRSWSRRPLRRAGARSNGPSSASRAASRARLGHQHVARADHRARSRRSRLLQRAHGIPSSSSRPSMNSASAWLCGARDLARARPSAYWGLILRAVRWRSLAALLRAAPGARAASRRPRRSARSADARARTSDRRAAPLAPSAHLQRRPPATSPSSIR